MASLAALSPQRRLVEPEAMAAVAVLLVSEDARGAARPGHVDGGAVQA